MSNVSGYPPVGDYGFIADGNSTALVSREGSIDWCCIRRIDSGSCFGRLLDRKKGGFCSISPTAREWEAHREYVEGTLVLRTTFESEGGEAVLYDCFTLTAGREEYPRRQLLRIVEGIRGDVELELGISPRFDYGELEPWVRQEGVNLYSAIGGDDGLLISCDAQLHRLGNHDLKAKINVRAGERARLLISFVAPEELDYEELAEPKPQELDRRLEETIEWWRGWSSKSRGRSGNEPEVLRSATILKALMNDATGAIAAAATTSLPEAPGGEMNWDYRYTWIRDSFFSVRSLAEIGFVEEADYFRRFIERSAAGNAQKLQVMYGVGGERRLTELELNHLEGYRGAAPVRIGNAAAGQLQLDMFGELLELSWLWHQRGNSPNDDYWRFLVEIVERTAELWREPDAGFWEARGEPQHFVRSKVMCWVALDRGIRLADETVRRAPLQRWKRVRGEIRKAVETEGYSEERGTFVQAFGGEDLDSVLLLLPRVGFVDYADERMVRTTDAIRDELDDDGLIRRFPSNEKEGAFLACSFWLVECLVHQGRLQEARDVFDRAISTGNDLGLFSEEYDTRNREMLGNFPQALTHLAHISAARALAERSGI